MIDPQTKVLQDRTDAKLRYAKVHLDELAALHAWSGGDFDRAHHESFLFHLFGVRDAFLAEINHYYRCGVPRDSLSQGQLRSELQARGLTSPELSELFQLEQDDSSWLRQAKDMRDHSTHLQGVPRTFFVGGPEDGQVRLKNPRTQTLTTQHFVDEFKDWWLEMQKLVERLRESAICDAGL